MVPAPERRTGAGFLAGAGGRLLPASVPFRWFGAAVGFHDLGWLALAAGAESWPAWSGGLGWPLAALHLATLGTLLASAIGASLQLLPVATRAPVRSPRLAALMWWAYVPGVGLATLGMGLARPGWLAAGAALVLAVLLAWALLLALNLRAARGMPGVVLHGWGAVVSIVLLGASAAALVALWNGHPLAGRETMRALHAAAGLFGVMGLLVFGLSAILLPMFALGEVPGGAAQTRAAALALAALALAALAAFMPGDGRLALALRCAALAVAALALALHVRMMRRVLAGGMRGDLGRAGRLIQVGWGAAALALLFALARLAWPADGAPWGRLFVLAAVAGWLLSFLFGVLQRIVPFLAAMHAARGQRRPPTPSALSHETALAWHERCHFAALALLAASALVPTAWLVALAAAVGAAGAVAFGVFFGVVLRRMRQAMAGVRPGA